MVLGGLGIAAVAGITALGGTLLGYVGKDAITDEQVIQGDYYANEETTTDKTVKVVKALALPVAGYYGYKLWKKGKKGG